MQRRGDARRRTTMNVQFHLLIESYGLWRKCFREQEALAREEAEEIRQHNEYRLQRAYERLHWEKEDVAKKAEKTAELQQVMVT